MQVDSQKENRKAAYIMEFVNKGINEKFEIRIQETANTSIKRNGNMRL